MEHSRYLATAFRDVDKNRDIEKLIACLRFMEELPSFHAYKEMSREQLRLKQGDTAVDIGCGLGFDVAGMARVVSPGGRSIGIDISEALLSVARSTFSGQEGVSFAQADIHNLPFSMNSVDGIRVDRTLQHVEEPQRVISEMVRVLKPGGWLVCAEPDWAAFVIDAEGCEMTDTVIQTWKSGFRNSQVGRQLLRRIRAEGLVNTWADGTILLADGMAAADIVYDIYATAEKVRAANSEKADAIEAWLHNLQEREDHEGVMACVTIFLAGGQKRR